MATDLQQSPKVLALYGTPTDVLEVLRGLGLSHGTFQQQQFTQPPHAAWPQPACCARGANQCSASSPWCQQAETGAQASPQQEPQQQGCAEVPATSVHPGQRHAFAGAQKEGVAHPCNAGWRAESEVGSSDGEAAASQCGSTKGPRGSGASLESATGQPQFFNIGDDEWDSSACPHPAAGGDEGEAGEASDGPGGERPVSSLRLHGSPEGGLPVQGRQLQQVWTDGSCGHGMLESDVIRRRGIGARHHGSAKGFAAESEDECESYRAAPSGTISSQRADPHGGFQARSDGEDGAAGCPASVAAGVTDHLGGMQGSSVTPAIAPGTGTPLAKAAGCQVGTPPVHRAVDFEMEMEIPPWPDDLGAPAGGKQLGVSGGSVPAVAACEEDDISKEDDVSKEVLKYLDTGKFRNLLATWAQLQAFRPMVAAQRDKLASSPPGCKGHKLEVRWLSGMLSKEAQVEEALRCLMGEVRDEVGDERFECMCRIAGLEQSEPG